MNRKSPSPFSDNFFDINLSQHRSSSASPKHVNSTSYIVISSSELPNGQDIEYLQEKITKYEEQLVYKDEIIRDLIEKEQQRQLSIDNKSSIPMIPIEPSAVFWNFICFTWE